MYGLYFFILAAVWCASWAAFFVLFANPGRNGLPLRYRLFLPGLLLAIPGVCLAAYPLAVRTADRRHPSTRPLMDLFVPVKWAIDNTSLQSPMLSYSELWGLRSELEADIAGRANLDSPANSMVILSVCLVFLGMALPPFIAARVYRSRWPHKPLSDD